MGRKREKEERRSIKKVLNLWNIVFGILSMPNLTLPCHLNDDDNLLQGETIFLRQEYPVTDVDERGRQRRIYNFDILY